MAKRKMKRVVDTIVEEVTSKLDAEVMYTERQYLEILGTICENHKYPVGKLDAYLRQKGMVEKLNTVWGSAYRVALTF